MSHLWRTSWLSQDMRMCLRSNMTLRYKFLCLIICKWFTRSSRLHGDLSKGQRCDLDTSVHVEMDFYPIIGFHSFFAGKLISCWYVVFVSNCKKDTKHRLWWFGRGTVMTPDHVDSLIERGNKGKSTTRRF